MDAIDLVMHGALIGVALVQVGPFWRARKNNPAGWPGIGAFAAVAALAALRVAEATDARAIWLAAFQVVAAAGPFWFWRMARTLFEDGFTPRPWHWALLAALEILIAARWSHPPMGGLAILAGRLLAAGIVLHAIGIILRGAGDDLIASRMRARASVVVAAGALALLSLARPLLADAAPRLVELIARATPLLDIAIIAFAAPALFRVERALWPPKPARAEAPAEPVDSDAAALARLDALMSEHRAWREPGLTVAAVAERVRVPEYRLRRLILERRGARNFSAFLNGYRLDEAATRLRAAEHARTPITTIAYDCGFASLGPFNRAFRDRFGATPSEYRRGPSGAAFAES
jgi:AraC-like DNA-binding protein